MIDVISARTKKILNLFYATLSVSVVLALVGVAQHYAPDPLSVDFSGAVEDVTIRSGEAFVFDRDVCVLSDLVVSVHREFYNTDTRRAHVMPGVTYIAHKFDGCYSAEFSAKVPKRVPPGRYVYRPVLIYKVNGRREIIKPAPIVNVTVIE